jgi:hypothetical protein
MEVASSRELHRFEQIATCQMDFLVVFLGKDFERSGI